MRLKKSLIKLMMSLLILPLILVSCSPKIQVGPETLMEPLTKVTTQGVAHLPKPNISLTKSQWDSLSRDVKEILVERELQWGGIYFDYLNRK